jgi:predicted transcriptional regulator of viral defense system
MYIYMPDHPAGAVRKVSMDIEVWMKVAKAPIHRYFERNPQKVFPQVELHRLFEQNRAQWRLSAVSLKDFMRLLPAYSKFSRLDLPLPTRKQTCYIWGESPLLPALLALDPKGYFSHQTALELHQLVAGTSDTIYLNVEQTNRQRDEPVVLEQARIDAAFKRAPRMSNSVAAFQGRQVRLLSGMQTGMLGIITAPFPHAVPEPQLLRVTNLERTLIDIVVRPAYSGGPHQLLDAYAAARGRTAVDALIAMLRELDYIYPYHQAIGFCLERAGHDEAVLAPLREMPMVSDFYLAHRMGPTAFIPKWRLHVPADLA